MPIHRRRRPGKPLGERITLPDGKRAILFTKKEFRSLKPPLPSKAQIIHSGKQGVVVVERREAKPAPGEKSEVKAEVHGDRWRIAQAENVVHSLRRTGWPELEIRLFLEQHGYPWP